MQPSLPTIALAAACATLLASGAAAQDSLVKRIIRGSVDGDRTYYAVSCTDGGRATLFIEHATDATCSVPRNGTPQCTKDGRLREVAEQACKAPARG